MGLLTDLIYGKPLNVKATVVSRNDLDCWRYLGQEIDYIFELTTGYVLQRLKTGGNKVSSSRTEVRLKRVLAAKTGGSGPLFLS